jgi:hypothetical protein
MSEMTLSDARMYLAQAVETQGRDFVYAKGHGVSCLNVPLGELSPVDRAAIADVDPSPDDPRHKTGCLVGTAFTLAGRTEHKEAGSQSASAGIFSFPTLETKRYLGVAQSAQDSGATWGEALDRAEAWYDGYRAGQGA